jgi:hypothetical protein
MPLKLSWNPFDPNDPGPIIRVVVMPPESEMEAGRAIGLEYPTPVPIMALIDTGSPFTIINKVHATNRRLRLTNPNVPLRTIGGRSIGEEHCCSLSFPESDLPRIDVMGIVAAKFSREPSHACLIGRDVIKHWNICFDGRSHTVTISV